MSMFIAAAITAPITAITISWAQAFAERWAQAHPLANPRGHWWL